MMSEKIKDYEFVDDTTIRRFNEKNTMWVYLKFSDDNNNDGSEYIKELIRDRYVESFR